MIAYIRGEITEKKPTHIYVEAGGIGYHVNISLNTFERIEALVEVKLSTYLHIKEDSHQLYGFHEEEEKNLFIQLISVSGIGPNTARVILSYMTPDEAISAIINDQPDAFHKVKGVGPKTAKRIILDLKDKVKLSPDTQVLTTPSGDNTVKQEALSALIALGFPKNQVVKALDRILQSHQGTLQLEELIKLSLKSLT